MATSDSGNTKKRSHFDSNICRLCSFAKDKVLPIFDTSGSKFDAKIKECLPSVKVAPSDGKPQQICLECITKLNIYYEFLCLCIRSDSYFDSYIRAFTLKKQTEQSLLNEISKDWTASDGDQQQSDGLIVLSKIDQPLSESIQDLVVVVELKYKDGAQETEPDPVPEYEDTEAPVEISNETDIKTAEHAISITSGHPSVEQTDPRSLRGQHTDKPSALFNEVTKEYECALCDKKFKRRSRLSSHLTRHTGIRPHACEKCEKSFGTMWELNIHSRIHKRDIICTQCNKAFTTNSKLERHSRVHTGERPFFCSYCGKNFGDKRNLDNHIRTHTGAKPYSCSVCDKTFSVQSHMVEHLNVHKKSASFHCAICSKAFRWRSNYKKHLKTHC